jgi:hypothetical protein
MATSQHLDAEQDARAEDILPEWELDDPGLAKSAGTVLSFVRSYSEERGERTLQEWLQQEFEAHPELWTSNETAAMAADEVIAAVARTNAARESLQAHLDQGRSQASWIAGCVEQGASAAASRDAGAYAATIETAIEQANQESWRVITRQDGAISQCYNLDGFIAEQHHVSSFNIDAAAKGSAYRARVLTPEPGAAYGKNSMDIGIYDGDGKLVRRYQVKYGADADATATLFDKGDYRGQRKLVPEGHADTVDGSTERIEIDGVESTPLSKEEAKARQRQAQQELEAKQYEWSEANRGAIARRLGKQALIGACITAGFQGVRILGRRAWNALTGKTNPTANEDLREFFESSLSSCKHVGIQVAVSGGLVVAAKSGWLGKVLKGTPAGRLADMACLGLQNAKVLYKFGKGELTGAEALDAMGETTISCALSLAAASQGASIGAAIGSVLGPVGAAAGGLAGGIAGGIAGSVVAKTLYEAGKSIARRATDTARDGLARIGEGIAQTGRALRDTASGMFAAVFG